MSKFDWRNGFAVGLTSGICAGVLVVLLLSSHQPREQSPQSVGYTKGQDRSEQNESDNPNVSTWWHWDGGLVSSRDTLAQWIMMFFTVVAASLLYGTLRTANQTNKAALVAAKAASDANEIMSRNALMDQRAWVTIKINQVGPIEKTDDGVTLVWLDMTAANTGKTPATGMCFHAEVRHLYNNSADLGPEWVTNALKARKWGATIDGGALAPGEIRQIRYGHAVQVADFASAEEVDSHTYKVLTGVVYQTVIADQEFFSFKVVSAIAPPSSLDMNSWNMKTIMR